MNFDEVASLDLTVDGADEVAPGLALIKGGGGNLLREKIVASATKRFVIIADQSKVVEKLGRFPLPVEVIQMAEPLVRRGLKEIGFTPDVRLNSDGTRFITDEGNLILDGAGMLLRGPAGDGGEAGWNRGVGGAWIISGDGAGTALMVAEDGRVIERTA